MLIQPRQCVGQRATSCSLVSIAGGSGDYNAFQVDQASVTARVTCWNSTSFLYPFPRGTPNAFSLATRTMSC